MKEETPINKKHEKDILVTISEHPVFTFKDIFVYYKGCSRSTAYEHGLDKSDNIREALYENKRKGVVALVAKWIKSDNATLQIAAMRLLCEPEEHRKLNQQYQDITTGGEKLQIVLSKDDQKL